MSVGDILSVGGAILTVAYKIQDLAQDWYIVSEDYRSKVEILRMRLETLEKQLHKHGLSLDGKMLKTLEKAELLLKKEEAKLQEVQKGGFLASKRRLMAKLDQVILPRKLERTLQNVIDNVERIPNYVKMDAELDAIFRERRDGEPLTTFKCNTIGEDFYVPIKASHSAVFKALNNSEGHPIILLYGGAGKGKSTLAKYVHEHSTDPREIDNKFEQVVWLACGPKADILAKQNELLQILDPNGARDLSSLKEVQGQGGLDLKIRRPLQGLLRSKKILLVLDDVWDDNFIVEMWRVSDKGTKYLITSQNPKLCPSLSKEILSIAMENPTDIESKRILASHIGLEGKEIPQGNLQVIADELIKKIDSNPFALASFANYFANKTNYSELVEETEWSNAYKSLSFWLNSKNEKFVLEKTEGNDSLWITMGRSIEFLKTGSSAKELLALTYMCEGPAVPEAILKTLFQSANSGKNRGLFFQARDELGSRKLMSVSSSEVTVYFGPSKLLSLHSLVQLYIEEKMTQEDIQSAINSLAIVRTEIDPNKSEVQPQIEMEEAEIEKARVVTALCALYFDHEHRDEGIKGFANRAAVKLKIPIEDLTKLRIRRKAIEPVVWLLGEIDTLTGPLDRAEQEEKGQQALRYSKKVFLKYVCEQQLDFSSIFALLTMVDFPLVVLAILKTLDDIFATEETSLLSGNTQSIVHNLSSLLKEDVEANIQESALGTLIQFLWKANDQENLMFPLSSMPGILEGLVRVLQDSEDRTMMSKTYALLAMGNLTYMLDNQDRLTILEYEGALQSIVKSLCNNNNPRLQEYAAFALGNLAYGKHRGIIYIVHFKGPLAGLVSSLHKDDNPALQRHAAGALRNLASGSDEEAIMEILDHKGALDGLVLSLLKNQNPSFQVDAAAALTNLAAGPKEAKLKILYNEGALAGLVGSLYKDDNPALQEKAAGALGNLALGPDEAKLEILHNEGALAGLIRSLHKDDNPAPQEQAVGALCNLALGPDEAKMEILHHEGALDGLVLSLLKNENPPLQVSAAEVLRNLAMGLDEAKMEILHHEGALDGLVLSLLKNENPPLQVSAIAALTYLTAGPKEAKLKILHHQGALAGLVRSLHKDDNPALQEEAAWSLGNLALGLDEATMEILHHKGALDGLVFSLLKNENPPLQVSATTALTNLAEGPKEAKLKILHHKGALAGLVRSLHKDDNPALQKEAAWSLGNLALGPDEATMEILHHEGALAGLVRSLHKDDNPALQEEAAWSLGNLALGPDEATMEILHHKGALDGLVSSLHKNDNPALQRLAAGALRNLACEAGEAKMKILHHKGALDGLVLSLLKDENPPLQVNAAAALTNLAGGPKEAKVKIIHHERALAGLVRSLHKDDNPALQEEAASSLCELALGPNEAKMEILHLEGALVGLVSSLHKDDNPALQKLVARVLRNLALGSNEAKMEILDHKGALDGLVLSLLKNENRPLQVSAAEALSNLAGGPKEAKLKILHHEGALAGLVRSVHKDDNPALQERAARSLCNLAEGPDEAKTVMQEAEGLSEGLLGLLVKHVAANTQRCAAYAITLIDPTLGKKASLVVGKAYLGRAEASAVIGMYGDALHDLDQANLLEPRDAEILSRRCFIKVKLGDLNGALVDANEAIAIKGGDNKTLPFYLQERGVLKQIIGDLGGAIADLNEGLKLLGDDDELLKHRGYVRFLMKDEEGARADAERAMTVKDALVDDPSYKKGLFLGAISVEYLGYKLR